VDGMEWNALALAAEIGHKCVTILEECVYVHKNGVIINVNVTARARLLFSSPSFQNEMRAEKAEQKYICVCM